LTHGGAGRPKLNEANWQKGSGPLDVMVVNGLPGDLPPGSRTFCAQKWRRAGKNLAKGSPNQP
jgi:hypothetical protein